MSFIQEVRPSALLKRVVIRNARVCCFVLQTAPLPFFIKQIDPRLGDILRQEDVQRIFKEVDLKLILQKATKIALFVRENCTVICVQVPKEVTEMTKESFRLFVQIIRQALTLAIRHGGPFLSSLYSKYREQILSISQAAPKYALIMARELLKMRFWVQSAFFQMKKYVNITDIAQFVSKCYHFVTANHHLDKCFKMCLKQIRESAPKMQVYVTTVFYSMRITLEFLRQNFISVLRSDVREELQKLALKIFHRLHELFYYLLGAYRQMAPFVSKVIKRFISIFKTAAKRFLPLIKDYAQIGYTNTTSVSKNVLRALLRERKHFASSVHEFFKLYLLPFALELGNTMKECFSEVTAKSTKGLRVVMPSLYSATRMVIPQAVLALAEVCTATKHSSAIVFPAMTDAFLYISPQLSDGMIIVVSDSRSALVEIAAATHGGTTRLGIAFGNVFKNAPVLFRAASKVTVTTFRATSTLILTCERAKSRVVTDVKRGRLTITTSCQLAERQLICVLKDALADDPHLQDLLRDLKQKHTEGLNHIAPAEILGHTILHCLTGILTQFNTSKKHSYLIAVCFQEAFAQVSLVVVPQTWHVYKHLTGASWRHFCEVSSMAWETFTCVCEGAWGMTCENTPRTWRLLQKISRATWEATNVVAPHCWKQISCLSPVAWQSSRAVVRGIWNASLKVSDDAWDCVVIPLTSASWSFALNRLPHLWILACDGSHRHWILLCTGVECGYEALTKVSSTSWKVSENVAKLVWRNGARQLTKNAFVAASRGLRFYGAAEKVLKQGSSSLPSWTRKSNDLMDAMARRWSSLTTHNKWIFFA